MTRITWVPPSVPVSTQANLRVQRDALELATIELTAPALGTPLTVTISGPAAIRALIADLEKCLEVPASAEQVA